MTKQQIEALRKMTPGQFHLRLFAKTAVYADSRGNVIASFGSWGNSVADQAKIIEEQEANALAFAALPDLLAEREKMIAALKEYINALSKSDTLRHISPEFPALDNARRLIAEAEGESNGKD